jgi:hypothetical protein
VIIVQPTDSRPELDAALAQRFAEARRPLTDAEFTAAVMARVARAHRARSVRSAAWVGLLLAAAAVAAPFVAEISLAVGGHLDAWLPSLGDALVSPVGWVCGSAMAVWSMWRVGVIR